MRRILISIQIQSLLIHKRQGKQAKLAYNFYFVFWKCIFTCYLIILEVMRFYFIAGQQEQRTRGTLFTDLNEIKFPKP